MELPTTLTSTPKIALLSAMGASVTGEPTMPLLFGQPTLAFQIEQLRKHGIEHFWVEVDTLPGAIVALADRLRKQDVVIDFVRSPQELSGKLDPNALLFVQAESIIADDELLAQMLAYNKPIVATVDGRDENDYFERIDLNTRWTGLAQLDRRTIDGIAALPDGWSIGSSLLRQALQDGVEHRLIKQDMIQSGKLRKISGPTDVDRLTKTLLKSRTEGLTGFIEARIFGRIARKLAPLIWPLKSGNLIVDGIAFAVALAASGIALAGFGAAAAAFGLLAILVLCVRYSLQTNDNVELLYRAVGAAAWTILTFTFAVILWKGGQAQLTDLFPGFTATALLVFSRRGAIADGTKLSILSPAMVAALMILFAAAQMPVGGAMLITMAQLALLLAGKSK